MQFNGCTKCCAFLLGALAACNCVLRHEEARARTALLEFCNVQREIVGKAAVAGAEYLRFRAGSVRHCSNSVRECPMACHGRTYVAGIFAFHTISIVSRRARSFEQSYRDAI